MLPKRRRLGATLVREAIAKGKGRRAGSLSLKIVENKGHIACAVVVSKKLAKTAVMRNRLRRAVYRALEKAPLPATGHFVFFVTAIPKGPLSEAFMADLQTLLHV
ncbi:MAG TPA: ribonuclease P protein component [Candidatus Paceibacterota bacterium]|nr:ribonuclease P protein component [Candidatus Paceibacterota bacterium]